MSATKILHLPQARPTPQEDWTPEQILEDYLDYLCAPLVGLVPYPERARLREESKYNLEGRIEGFELSGMTQRDATLSAIEKFGKSEKLAAEFIETWQTYHEQRPIIRKLGFANSYATIVFGFLTALCYLFLNLRMMMPSESKLLFGENVQLFRTIGMPLPDGSTWTYVFLSIIIFAPFIGGWLVGSKVILHTPTAIYQVMVLMVIGTFFLGVALLPSREGLFVALAEALWWLPVGCLTAHFAAALAWRRRCVYHSIPMRRKS